MYHIISYHIISYLIISYHIISYHISYHIISHHITSYHIIISYRIVSYHIIISKLEFSGQVSKKYSHMKIHENLSCGSKVDGRTRRSRQSLFAKMRKATVKNYTVTEQFNAISDSHNVIINTFLWFEKPYTLIHRYQRFRRNYYSHLHGRRGSRSVNRAAAVCSKSVIPFSENFGFITENNELY
jgi:hypothetical protein